MDNTTSLIIGKGEQTVALLPMMANRHGMIAGATGTGKTVSLKVLAEQFSEIGVPVFLADVKGDLASISQAGNINPKLQERLDLLGIKDFKFAAYPVRLWDVFGQLGHPMRTTISEMGPLLLSRILNLNDTQAGVLNLVFKIADDNEYLLIDLKDLRSMLQFVGDNAEQYTTEYGNISKPTIGAIQRALLTIEEQGGDEFFAEPAFEINDLMEVDSYGKGMINILASEKLMMAPALYSTFMLWLLAELFEQLPEVGDLEKPKLVFFFDEAHLLFSDTPKVLSDKIELVVRLIRSKGVGVYFITQNPIDIPEKILGQLGNRIQHAIRAYTPKEQKAIDAMAETFRQNPKIDIPSVITQLKTGEALVSMLDHEGRPGIVEQAMIYPPHSLFGVLDPLKRQDLIKNSPFHFKYHQVIDKESAYERIRNSITEKTTNDQQTKDAVKQEKEALALEKARLQVEREREKLEAVKQAKAKKSQNEMAKIAKSFMGTMSSSVGREIARGIFNTIIKRR
jgi:uncharacterized protein